MESKKVAILVIIDDSAQNRAQAALNVTVLHSYSLVLPCPEGDILAHSDAKWDSRLLCSVFHDGLRKVVKVVIYRRLLRAREESSRMSRMSVTSADIPFQVDYRRGLPGAIQLITVLALRARVVTSQLCRRTVTTLGRVDGQGRLTQAVRRR